MVQKPTNIREKLYEGAHKILYESGEELSLVQFFKDDHVLENGEIIEISGKGILKNKISSTIMSHMDIACIDNHFIEQLNMREQLVQLVDIVPVHVSVSNIASSRYSKEFGIEEGYVFDTPMFDFRIKSKECKNPVTNEQQIEVFCGMTSEEVKELKQASIRVNDFLTGLFSAIGIRLVECTLEFGRVFDGEQFSLMLADEITPDNCRLWDMNSNNKLDFEYASLHPDTAILVYQEIAKRLDVR